MTWLDPPQHLKEYLKPSDIPGLLLGDPDTASPWFAVAVTPPATGCHPSESLMDLERTKLTRPAESQVKHGALSPHRHTNNKQHQFLLTPPLLPLCSDFNEHAKCRPTRHSCERVLSLAHNQRRGELTGGAVPESGSRRPTRARGNARGSSYASARSQVSLSLVGVACFQFKYLIWRDTALLCMPLDGNLNNIYMSFMSFKAAPKSGVSTVCTLKAALIPLASRIPRRRICKWMQILDFSPDALWKVGASRGTLPKSPTHNNW